MSKMEEALVDNILDECSQIRILLVGSARGKAQLIREVFGVNRITRYPADYSRDEEIYSKENEYFVAHVFENWQGVADVLRRRKKGEPDEVIHCIWHYVDSQDAADLVDGTQKDQLCPEEVRRQGIPIITFFGRFDNVVTRSSEIGHKRRMGTALTEADHFDARHIRKTSEAIGLYLIQYPGMVAIASKAPSSKLAFLDTVLRALKSSSQVQMLFIIAQRLDPSIKFETSMSLAMKQFLLGTVSTASPLPIPFAGLIGSSAASYMIKQDILRIWNIYDPDFLCGGAQGQKSLMDSLLGIPEMGVKRLVYMIPVIAQINGIWETPRMARALGGLMIDLMLLMERAFIATMSGIPDGLSPARTPARMDSLAASSPRTPQTNQYGSNGTKTPLSAEVLRNRKQLFSESNTPNPSPLNISSTPLIDLTTDQRPATPPRPTPRSISKPVLPPKPPRPHTPNSYSAGEQNGSNMRSLPPKPLRPPTPATQVAGTPGNARSGMPSLIVKTPVNQVSLDVTIRPSSLPLTSRMLEGIITEYRPVQKAVKDELEEFFDQEGQGLARSFQKDTVRQKLDSIVRKWRISKVIERI